MLTPVPTGDGIVGHHVDPDTFSVLGVEFMPEPNYAAETHHLFKMNHGALERSD